MFGRPGSIVGEYLIDGSAPILAAQVIEMEREAREKELEEAAEAAAPGYQYPKEV